MDKHTERMVRYTILKAEKHRQLARRRKFKNKVNRIVEAVKVKAPGMVLILVSFIFSQFSKGEDQTAAAILFFLGVAILLFANVKNAKTIS